MQLLSAKPIDLTIEGLVKRAVVSIRYDLDHDIDFSYWDAETAKATQNDLERGRVLCLYIQVEVKFSDLDGFEGVDSLGQVFVRPSSHDKDILQTVKDHGMIDNASQDLIDRVLKGVEQINQFLGKAA